MTGSCTLCRRESSLTFHHLIPKKVHRRKHFRKKYSREELNKGIYVCRYCHNGLHKYFSETQLAREFHTKEAILAHEPFQKHIAWSAKQKKI